MPTYTPVQFALLDLTVMVTNQISWNIEISGADYVVEPVFTKDVSGVTEAEAEALWCPQIRVGQSNRSTTNRAASDKSTSCVGSGCMVWQWDHILGVKQATGRCGFIKPTDTTT